MSQLVVIECYNCGAEIPVELVNEKMPGCIRCPECGQKTCGE
ncbi:hypothetical protein [Aneurinibacillus tyrosinisolvens]|nr:hypothetical protein [Aneurinibacillus tyrosinisolvens]